MSETILVVEDGDAVRNLICLMLVQSGYRVLEARDGREALRVCETHAGPIALVLTDLVMPHMRGTELAERLQLIRPEIRVLLMSGYADDPVVQRLGPDSTAFLEKPFTSVLLMEKVRKVLDAPRYTPPAGKRPDG